MSVETEDRQKRNSIGTPRQNLSKVCIPPGLASTNFFLSSLDLLRRSCAFVSVYLWLLSCSRTWMIGNSKVVGMEARHTAATSMMWHAILSRGTYSHM